MIKITELVHQIINEKKDINIAVDMTVGWGNDTLALAKQSAFVYGFDIQKDSLNYAELLLRENGFNNFRLINDNHEFVLNYVNEKIDIVIYNLGYLPKGNKEIKTEASSTLNSLKSILTLLNTNGLVVLVVYSHNLKEKATLLSLCENLSIDYDVVHTQVLNRKNSPELIKIKKVV